MLVTSCRLRDNTRILVHLKRGGRDGGVISPLFGKSVYLGYLSCLSNVLNGSSTGTPALFVDRVEFTSGRAEGHGQTRR